MMGYYWGMDGWGWLFMLLPTLFFFVLVGLGVWAIVARSEPGRHGGTALDLLKRRYALGDISREEYVERRRDLA
jgi:putative membrane protein